MIKGLNWQSFLGTAIKYLLALVLLIVVLFPKFPLWSVKGTFVAIRLEDLVLFLSALAAIISIYFGGRKTLKNPISESMALYILGGLISLISAIFVLETVKPNIGILHLLRRIEYFSVFFLAVEAARRNKKLIIYFSGLIFLIIILAFGYGVGQKYANFPVIVTQNEEYSKGLALRYIDGAHINSTFAGHYDLATFLVLILPIVAAFMGRLPGLRTKVFLAVSFFAGLWLLVNSASRISFLSYLVALTIALFLVRRLKLALFLIFISLLFIGSSSNLISRYGRFYEVLTKKYLTVNLIKEVYAQSPLVETIRRGDNTPTPTPTPVLEDRSTNIRLAVEWPRAIRAFSKNPILGTGYSSITLATDNDYLRLLGETGLVGFLCFLLIIFRIFKRLFINIPFGGGGIESFFIAGTIGGIAGVLINAIFIDVFEASKFAIVFWIIVGIAMCSGRKKIYE